MRALANYRVPPQGRGTLAAQGESMNIDDTVPALPDVRKEWTQHAVWPVALAGIKQAGSCVCKEEACVTYYG